MSTADAKSNKRKRPLVEDAEPNGKKKPNLLCVHLTRAHPCFHPLTYTSIIRGPQTIVTVNVKRDPLSKTLLPFRVHKNYICHYSPYFEAAFNGNFVEGETQVLELDDTDPRIFGMFVNWIYTQELVNEEGNSPSCTSCINLWILADRLLVPSLQNQALVCLDLVRSKWGSGVPGTSLGSKIFKRVWDNTTEESPLRSYLVEAMVRKPKSGGIKYPEDYPHDMLVAIINGLRDREYNRNLREGVHHDSWIFSDAELDRFRVAEGVGVEARKDRTGATES